MSDSVLVLMVIAIGSVIIAAAVLAARSDEPDEPADEDRRDPVGPQADAPTPSQDSDKSV